MKHDLTWSHSYVSKQDRQKQYGHASLVIWFTGLSASGKTTLARRLEQSLFERGVHTFLLDGDNIRHGLNSNLGFSPAERQENVRRLGEVAKLFVDAGIVVIVSAISPHQKDRDAVRGRFQKGEFFEVYVKCSLEECEKRDPKGLYQKARNGQLQDFTGIHQTYEEPTAPELVIPTDKQNVKQSLEMIKKHVMLPVFVYDEGRNQHADP